MTASLTILFDKSTCRGIVAEEKYAKELEEKWFGRRENGVLTLDIVEVAYLLMKNRVIVESGGVHIGDLESFLRENYMCLKDFFWPKLIVYRDLRERGRRVRVLSDDKFIVKDKYGDLRYVVILEEGRLRNVSDILSHVEITTSNNLKLVYAIVSLQGDLTYYELTKINPKRD